MLTPKVALKSTFKAHLTHNRYSRFVTFDIIFIWTRKVKFFSKCFLCKMSKNKSQFLTEYAIKPPFTTIYGVFCTPFCNTFCEIFKNRANYYKIVTKFLIFLTISMLVLSLFYVFFWLIIPDFYYTIIYSVILYKINKKMTEKKSPSKAICCHCTKTVCTRTI